jgi:hypothetical protein
MKLAIIGSRSLINIDISSYIPPGVKTIITGGARGIDTLAASYAKKHGIELVEILPDYKKHKRGAPIRRNDHIVDLADMILAFWDGKSKGTEYVVNLCKKRGKECRVILI